jgi:hypothetical protein
MQAVPGCSLELEVSLKLGCRSLKLLPLLCLFVAAPSGA